MGMSHFKGQMRYTRIALYVCAGWARTREACNVMFRCFALGIFRSKCVRCTSWILMRWGLSNFRFVESRLHCSRPLVSHFGFGQLWPDLGSGIGIIKLVAVCLPPSSVPYCVLQLNKRFSTGRRQLSPSLHMLRSAAFPGESFRSNLHKLR